MARKISRRVVHVLATLLASGACTAGLAAQPVESGHAPVNGICMYYEVHGPGGGMPLVLLRFLKVDRVDFFGFSNGASVGLQVAIRHPALVHKLVFASSMTRRDGAQPQF